MAIGDPVGLAWTATFGRVSALRSGRDLQVPETTVVQFDAAVNPGNSGGPLIDRDGRAIGIVTAKVNNAQGLGFAMGGDDIWTRCTAWIAAAAN
jgi:S1-C subfamily serine protease